MDKAVIMAVAEAHARRELLDELKREIVKMQQPLIDRAKTPDILRRYWQHGEFDAYEYMLAIIRKHREERGNG